MRLTEKQADELDREADAVADAAQGLMDALANLTTGGESCNRTVDTREAADAYTNLRDKWADLKQTALKYKLDDGA